MYIVRRGESEKRTETNYLIYSSSPRLYCSYLYTCICIPCETKNNVDREKERETVLEIATEEMANSGYSTDNYQLEVERYNSDGTYDVRMLQDGEKTKFYYTVDPDTKETTFNLEVQSNANKEKERLAE